MTAGYVQPQISDGTGGKHDDPRSSNTETAFTGSVPDSAWLARLVQAEPGPRMQHVMTGTVTTCNLALMTGGMYQNQADPLANMRSRLEQAFEQAGAGSLAFDAWEDLCTAESDLENSLFPQLETLQEAGNFAVPSQVFSGISDLLDRLAAIAGVLIEHHPGADYDPEKLAKIADTKTVAAKRSITDRAYGLIMAGTGLGPDR